MFSQVFLLKLHRSAFHTEVSFYNLQLSLLCIEHLLCTGILLASVLSLVHSRDHCSHSTGDATEVPKCELLRGHHLLEGGLGFEPRTICVLRRQSLRCRSALMEELWDPPQGRWPRRDPSPRGPWGHPPTQDTDVGE